MTGGAGCGMWGGGRKERRKDGGNTEGMDSRLQAKAKVQAQEILFNFDTFRTQRDKILFLRIRRFSE